MRGLGIVLTLFLLGGTIPAAEFWDAKAPSEWTDQEIEVFLSDSPWAITKTIAQGSITARRPVGAKRRVRPTGGPARTIRFTTRWLSAEPVREAFTRYLTMSGAARHRAQKADNKLSQADSHFLIMVDDIPAAVIARADIDEPDLQRGALLTVKDKFEIEASQVDLRRSAGMVNIIFYFPRRDDITVEDKEIQFKMKIGATTIKREFKPSEMVVNGKLTL